MDARQSSPRRDPSAGRSSPSCRGRRRLVQSGEPAGGGRNMARPRPRQPVKYASALTDHKSSSFLLDLDATFRTTLSRIISRTRCHTCTT